MMEDSGLVNDDEDMEDSGLVNDDEYMTEDSGPENDIDDETSHSTKLASIDIIIIKPDTLLPTASVDCPKWKNS